jgi:hypothetical protein
MASSRSGSSLWVRAWLRAVALPAWRRTAAVWASLAIVASIVMGPTALRPGDLVELLLHGPAAAMILGALWLALFHPIAKILARAEAASFLRSLPAPRLAKGLPVAMLAAMQVPPLALFCGGGEPGWAVAVWLGCSAASWLLAQPVLPRRAARPLRWTSSGQALRAVLASRLLVDDALLRGLAFAGLAGVGAALMIRNNDLIGQGAATLGLGTMIILGTPAWAAVTQPLAVAHRRIWPLCASTGMSATSWVASQAVVLGGTMAALCTMAALIAGGLGGLGGLDVVRLSAGAIAVGAASGVAGVRVGEWATRTKMVAERTLTGTLLVAACNALLLGLFGEVGILAAVALAAAALARTQEPVLC